MKIFLFSLHLGLVLSCSALAQRMPVFFSVLGDVPVMEGLAELPESALLFDKPAGRVAEVTAKGLVKKAAIIRFYDETLPQLGWSVIGSGVYSKEGEKLMLIFLPEAVIFRLEPA